MKERKTKRPFLALAQLAAITAASLFMPSATTAQTFTQQVQQHHSGEGTVTIHHDASIDLLVNGSTSTAKPAAAKPAAAKPAAKPAAAKPAAAKPAAAKPAAAKPSSAKPAAAKPASAKPAAAKPAAAKPAAAKPAAAKPAAAKPSSAKPVAASKTKPSKAKPQEDTTRHKPLADTTKAKPQADTVPSAATVPGGLATGSSTPADTIAIPATPRRGYKTTGYRVQAFAGGNTRKDRQHAERTGNAIRQLLPGEDVYVRFYSPRWVCRVGNYLTYEEAHEKMLLIRKLGYETATIVKGKIIVYYNQQENEEE